ncbi:hypothetical protein K2173_005667 [Erythroxylum novogranatense]|uniref:VQ domain-containing protein n=1 Tax=Erythroxylum novogranatense TaxID=1862640 RepID=A0AAV8SQE8_9ROSI|nr:hypothetical protein K2173_005667 [Erythroxylum novogranatense]
MNSSTRRGLQGPRPAPLVLDSAEQPLKNMKKQSRIPVQSRPPVIVYVKSPDIIHVRPEEFMGLVQRLTGKQQSSEMSSVSNTKTLPSCSMAAHSNVEDDDNSSVERVDFGEGQQRFNGADQVGSLPGFFDNIYTDWTEFDQPGSQSCT